MKRAESPGEMPNVFSSAYTPTNIARKRCDIDDNENNNFDFQKDK